MLAKYLSRVSYQQAFNRAYKHLMGEVNPKYKFGYLSVIGAIAEPAFKDHPGFKYQCVGSDYTPKRLAFYNELQRIEYFRYGRRDLLIGLARKYNLKVPQSTT